MEIILTPLLIILGILTISLTFCMGCLYGLDANKNVDKAQKDLIKILTKLVKN